MENVKTILGWVANNWSIIIGVICVIIILYTTIKKFLNLTADAQKQKVKQCLLSWVTEAEKELGSKTGKIKLSLVYSWFIKAFPLFQVFISLDTFGAWVDEALNEMKETLEMT